MAYSPVSGSAALRPLALLCALVATGCATAPPSRLELADLSAGEGYAVLRLYRRAMVDYPEAIWGVGFRLYYQPTSARVLSSGLVLSRLRGRFIPVEASESGKLVVLKLQAGRYDFFRVVSGLQEQDVRASFEVLPGRLTYVGDLQLDLILRQRGSGTTARLDGVSVRSRWQPEAARRELSEQYPGSARAMLDAN
jgi:hypothetical protein